MSHTRPFGSPMIKRTKEIRRSARAVVESIEPRKLLSFSAAINFQPDSTAVPAGFVADIGQTYAPRNGLTYGWDLDNRSAARDRGTSSTRERSTSTLIHFSSSRFRARTWEIAVPNGTYSVQISAGDPSFFDSRFAINVEGSLLINHQATSNARFATGSANVTVRDGRLTISSANGAINNKINSIQIKSANTTTAGIRLSAPTNLRATGIRADAVDLAWNDPSNGESKFIVEQSNDGKNFSRIATLDTGVVRHFITGLAHSSLYFFRVSAENAGQISAPSNTIRINTSQPRVTSSGQRPTTSTGYFDGISVSDADDVAKSAPHLRKLGITAVRMWSDLEWNQLRNRLAYDRAIEWHRAGFKVTLLLHDDKTPTYDQAKTFFEWVLRRPGLKDAVDRWEIVNEPNKTSYWKGTQRDYVQNVLRAASDVFRPRGEEVVGAGPTWDVNALKTLISFGYLDYVDYANFHPYGNTPADQISRLQQVKRLLGDTPLTITEWNIHAASAGTTRWAQQLNELRPWIKANVESAFYFCLVIADTWAGPAGLLKIDGTGAYVPNEPFYSTFDRW
jgi:hypothetical protein